MAADLRAVDQLVHQRWYLNTTSELECVLRETRSHEDIILLPLLLAASRNGPGTFVEIGANSGDAGSQTMLLERCFGWRGVLIEGSPREFSVLEQTQRSSTKVHSAVCKEDPGNITIRTVIRGCVGTRSQCFPMVPCRPLPAIIASAGFPRANYLSLDVEGHEALALETVMATHADNFPFDVVLVEIDHRESAKNERVRALLRQAGLKQLPIPTNPGSFNDLFAKPSLGDPRRPLLSAASLATRKSHFLKPLIDHLPKRRSDEMNRTSSHALVTRLLVGMTAAVNDYRVQYEQRNLTQNSTRSQMKR